MTRLITEQTIKPGQYASTYAFAGSVKYTAIARVDREISDSAPSRDSTDVLFEMKIGKHQFLRRRSELRQLQGPLLKGRAG